MNDFLDEIIDSIKGFKLTRGEQDALAEAYKTGRKHSESYDWQRFKLDIRKESQASENILDRQLSPEGEKIIDMIKEHLELKNATTKLMIEFKSKDRHDRKMLERKDIENSIKSIGLTLSAKQFDELFRILRISDGKYAYLDLMTLIVGPFAAQALGKQTVIELE